MKGQLQIMRTWQAAVLLVFVVLFTTCMARAQLVSGNITGTVTDPQGARVPGARVHITNQSTGLSQDVVTNEAGIYTSNPLGAGTYKVVVSKEGFTAIVSGAIVLDAAAHVTQDVTLKVGSTSETVVVSSQPPELDTTDPMTAHTIDMRAAQQLPVNGRSALALATLVPGVVSNLGAVSQGFADRGVSASAIRISGGVTGQNANLLDGVNNINYLTTEVGVNVKSDALQEFRIMTGVIPAQFGYTSGGVINIVTRSGGNAFHGSLYEFFRNDYLDANIAFPRSPFGKPKTRFNNYGGTIGGPILRQKLFFFVNLEKFDYISASPVYATVPTAQEYAGDFSDLGTLNSSGVCTPVHIYDPTTATTTGTRTQYLNNKITNLDPVAVAYTKMFYPQPNNAAGPYNPCTHANNYIGAPQRVTGEHLILGRLDYQVRERDSIAARYALYDNSTNNAGGYNTYFNRNDDVQTQNALLAETHIFGPTLINELRLGATRNGFPFQTATANQNISQKIGLPDPTPLIGPRMSNGLAEFNTTYGFRTNTGIDFSDDVTLLHGNHSIHFGASYRWMDSFNYQLNTGDLFSFSANQTAAGNNTTITAGTGSAFASFMAGWVSTASDFVGKGYAMRKANYAGWVQDDWRVNQRLTINAGLRYDFQPQSKEKKNGLDTVDLSLPNGSNPALMGYVKYAGHGYGTNFSNENFNDWGPRLGFVLRLTEDSKTVLRGGYAVYYTPNAGLEYQEASGNINGFSSLTTSYSSPTKTGPAFQLSSGLPYAPSPVVGVSGGQTAFLGAAIYVAQPTAKDPSSQQYTLSLSRELPWQTVLEATYLGNKGRHFPYSYNVNQNTLDPQYFSLGTAYLNASVANPYAGLVPGALGATTITRSNLLKPYPYYTAVYQSYSRWQGYDGNFLYVTATRRAASGLQIIGSYTYGKLMDDPIFDQLLNSPGGGTNVLNGPQNWRNPRAEYSVDVQDVTHRMSVSGLYDLPFGKGKKFLSGSGFTNTLVGGWQFNTVFIFEGGRPLVIAGANNQGIATRPNLLPGAKVKLDHPSLGKWFNTAAFVNPPDYTFGNMPRAYSHARGPAQTNFDMSLFKTTNITEGVRLELRLEAFNALNHTNLGQPNTTFVAGPAADPSNPTAEGGANTSSTFGTITSALSPRNVQLGMKLHF